MLDGCWWDRKGAVDVYKPCFTVGYLVLLSNLYTCYQVSISVGYKPTGRHMFDLFFPLPPYLGWGEVVYTDPFTFRDFVSHSS